MFDAFDPLQLPDMQQINESLLRERQKRNIFTVLHSYTSWYDPFSELIQNALDSVEKRARNSSADYEPAIVIRIDDDENAITVTDNGVGLDEEAFRHFLGPNVSFKDELSRGSKGVGATFLAYGYNYIAVDTKTKNFSASGVMEEGRNWLHEKNPSSSPKMYPNEDDDWWEPDFETIDTGVSVTVVFDEHSRPSDVTWPKLQNADSWLKALRIKTALGAIKERQSCAIKVVHTSKEGVETEAKTDEVYYLSPYTFFSKTKEYGDVIERLNKEIAKKGADVSLPQGIKNLNAIYIDWEIDEVLKNLDNLTEEERSFIKEHPVRVIGCYLYSAKVWEQLSEKLGCRGNANIFAPGIQLGADNMPQGEMIQVPLKRYTGRQNQVHFVIHFDNCIVDLGRKGFDKAFVDVAKEIARLIVQHQFSKVKPCLRQDDVRRSSLLQQEKISNWMDALSKHESDHPLDLKNENFFNPVNEISITAEPSREQDVIALFNQLIAGGVIRGVKVIGTNELMTYDGAYRVIAGPDYNLHEYDAGTNPLGISEEQRHELEDAFPKGFTSGKAKILEYKFSGDGLISDINTDDKVISDIDLLVCWEMGEEYEQYFKVQSLLVPEGESFRQYHGVTHLLFDENGKQVMDAVVLSDLISFLNDPEAERERQEELYE